MGGGRVPVILLAVALGAGCAPSPDVGPTQTAGPQVPATRPLPPSASAPTTGTASPPTTSRTTTGSTTTSPTSTSLTTTGPAASGAVTGAATTEPRPAGTAVPNDHYPLATDTLTIVDDSRPTVSDGRTIAASRTLTTLVWRPAAPGRWPLIVFAHGFEVGPSPYVALLEAWAGAGYVVAAPEFPLTDHAVAGANLDENDIQQQPADVRYVLDTLVAPTTALSGDIDTSRVLLAGHSDGAETVLAESEVPPPPGQPAVRAVVCMGVSPLPGQITTGNPPILVAQGDADAINPQALGMQAYAAASAPKWYLDLLGAGHLPPLEGGSVWLPAIEASTLVFFHLYVSSGDPSTLLAAGNVPGISTIRAG